MDLERESKDFSQSSHLILLIGYTIFVCMHIIITFLLGWEKWILILILAGVAASWGMHIFGLFKTNQRLWLIASFMMCTYFIYGTHTTSTFDNAIVMASLMMFFILVRMKGLITLCEITFYITYTYDLFQLARGGFEFDMVNICRIVMNYSVVTMLGYFAKLTISKWENIMKASQSEIDTLTDSTERLNDFLANVSHEIRTPVNAIIGLSGICIENEDNSEMKQNLMEVSTAGHKIAEQIGDILDFSEIDRGRLVRNDEDYMVSSMMNDLANDFRVLMKEGIELVIDVDPDIPAVLHGDVTKLKKIIRSLISNGFKFTNEGGVYLKLESDRREYGINLCIEVSDTGVGMTQEEIERVFERFYQSDSGRSRAASGLGLGLGIVSGFVSLMGGFMNITSTVGEGTTVKISIPQTVVDDNRCISVTDPKGLALCAFLDLGSFKNPMVREFYDKQSFVMARSLNLEMHRATNSEGLKKLTDSNHLSHLLVGEKEYRENRKLIDDIAKATQVIIVTEPGSEPERMRGIRLLEKPFYAFPLVSILNTVRRPGEADDMSDTHMMMTGIRALVVDDEPMNLVVAKSIFKKYGMVISTAISGQQSIDTCKENVYDLIFMDHMMSGMDGVEAMKKIRGDVKGKNRETPVIALTANAMSSAKQMFISEGFDGFVSKPIEIEELERVLKKILPKNAITYVHNDEYIPVQSDDLHEEDASASDAIEFEPDTVLEYSAETSNEQLIQFEKIKADLEKEGIDVETGLGFTGNDPDLYTEVILQFAGEMDQRIDKLNCFFADKDWKNYEIIIHATKSASKMIGAIDLSEKARMLEEAATDGNPDYIYDNHLKCMKECKTIGDYILGCFGKTSGNGTVQDDEVLEFSAESDDVLEFSPDSDDEVLEFDPQ